MTLAWFLGLSLFVALAAVAAVWAGAGSLRRGEEYRVDAAPVVGWHCLACNTISWHRRDGQEKYCGRCRGWTPGELVGLGDR